MSLVVLQVVGQVVLIAETPVVKPFETSNPVTLLQSAVALNIVLTTGKVPHEITPIHEVALVRKEKLEVIPLRGDLNLHGLATAVVVDDIALNTTHPVFILLGMGTVVHTWENHILGIDIAVFGVDNEVGVLLVFTTLLLTAVDGRARLHTGHTHAVFLIEGHL